VEFAGPSIDWYLISPLLVLLGGALVLLLGGAVTPRWPRGMHALLTAVIAGAALVLVGLKWGDLATPQLLVGDALVADRFGVLATGAMLLSLLMVTLVLNDHLERSNDDAPEPFGLMLTSVIGGVLMVMANDFVVMFLGLETLSLSFYLLAASDRRREESGEAGLKYFILGGFASAFFLYGVAMIFGASGSTRLSEIAQVFGGELRLEGSAMLLSGVALLLVGFAFKVSLVPFHSWTPDVYQGAPTPITALFASVGKVVAFAAMIRVFTNALGSRADDWRPVLWVLAALTLVVGSALAVVQRDVKRMMAYSSISHAGFILVGVVAASQVDLVDAAEGTRSAIAYLLIYSVLVVGTFAAISAISGQSDQRTSLDDIRGLAKAHPVFGLAVTVLLLAQAGVPLTSGFVAKFGVIASAVGVESYVLATLAMVSAVIAAFLYLRIMVGMWLSEGDRSFDRPALGTSLVLGAAVIVTIAVGFFPDLILNLVESI
jgi:NADH-quinone oxidoreductase subunit N